MGRKAKIEKIEDNEKNVIPLETKSLRPEYIPELKDWIPEPEDLVFQYVDEIVRASFSSILKREFDKFEVFIINKKHYKERMTDIVHHINYYVKYYDTEQEYFLAVMSVKYLIDTKPKLSQKSFKNYIINRLVTPSFVENIKRMSRELHTVNINTDKEGKYKSTPKITNDQAKLILSVSFAIRMLLPLCIHYSNVNVTIVNNRDYIKCFDNIFMDVMSAFETPEIQIFNPLCGFVKYRLDRSYNADAPIWDKKKQLYGINYETVFQDLIHEVILVKSLYKISYDRSVVSYIDGVVSNSYNHFRFENFKSKPVEIDASDSGGDNDDYLTHAESLEMSIYRIDESNMLLNDENNRLVLESIHKNFQLGITEDDTKFYQKHVVITKLTQFLLNAFYSKLFNSNTAIYTITREETINLLVILKKYLQAKGMSILPQICTANVYGRFKENSIKNSRFLEKLESSSVYQNIIQDKFRYIAELKSKDDPIIKRLSTIINSSFVLVDPDPEINGVLWDDISMDKIIDEFLRFLSII